MNHLKGHSFATLECRDPQATALLRAPTLQRIQHAGPLLCGQFHVLPAHASYSNMHSKQFIWQISIFWHLKARLQAFVEGTPTFLNREVIAIDFLNQLGKHSDVLSIQSRQDIFTTVTKHRSYMLMQHGLVPCS